MHKNRILALKKKSDDKINLKHYLFAVKNSDTQGLSGNPIRGYDWIVVTLSKYNKSTRVIKYWDIIKSLSCYTDLLEDSFQQFINVLIERSLKEC